MLPDERMKKIIHRKHFFRWMLWKIQSGIAPPFLYVVIGERDKLKALSVFLFPPRIHNTVDPNVQSHQMYPVNEVGRSSNN